MSKPTQPERREKEGASAAAPLSDADAASAMERFKKLARRVVKVPKAQVEAEEKALYRPRPRKRRRP
jgi:hypothetical protein